MFADQFNNIHKAEHQGFAKKVHLTYDTPKDLLQAINDVLTNDR